MQNSNKILSIVILHRCSEDVREELENLQATREKQKNALTTIEAIKNLSRYEIRTPFLLSIFVFLFTMFSGPYAIIFYAVEIFKDAGVDSNQHLAAIITALVRIGGGILSIFLIKKLPRVKLAMVSMFVMSISMIALGTVIYFKDQYEDNISFQVLPIVLVTIYMFSFGAGKEHSRNYRKHYTIAYKMTYLQEPVPCSLCSWPSCCRQSTMCCQG